MPQHDASYSSSLDPYVKREPLLLDPSAFTRRQDSNSRNISPSSIVPLRSPEPQTAGNSPSSRDSGSELHELDDEKEPSSGPERSRSVSSGKSDKEKRKRSRVTPEQLVHLERFFLLDRSPTAARRREISDILGMQERQTQIWFQNRRAKAKLQDGKQRPAKIVEVPPESPPHLSKGFQVDLHNLIHEDEPVTIIPCTDLSIGTWRRISTTAAKHDLIAYVCDVKRCVTWFIHSAGFGFKMEIPFETIIDTEFTNAAPGSGLASFLLSQPPIFYLENVDATQADGSPARHWKRCSDWTEGQQATHVMRHDLIGSAVQLAHILRNLHSNDGVDIPLLPPSYRTEQSTSPMPAMELPLPPMAGLTGPGYHYQNDAVDSPPPPDQTLFRKRSSYTNPGVTTHSPESAYSHDSDHPPPYSASSAGSFSQHQAYSTTSSRSTSSSYDSVNGSIYTEYMPAESHQGINRHIQPMNEYSDVPVSHGLAPRAYSAQPVSRAFYEEAPARMVQPYQAEEVHLRRSRSSGNIGHAGANHYEYHGQNTSSPPLLTTPFHPPAHLLEGMSNGNTDQYSSVPPSAMSGLPNVMGYAMEDHHRRHL